MTWDTMVVVLLVAASAGYLVWRYAIRKQGCACHCSGSGCCGGSGHARKGGSGCGC